MPRCDHCMLDFPEREAVHDVVDGREMVFCCHGCQGIYRLIHGEGLDDFYDKRSRDGAWFPGPSEQRSIDASAFGDNVRKSGDDLECDLVIDGIRCASCVWLNEKFLMRTPGVTDASVNYATHRARIRWDPRKIELRDILQRVLSIGYVPKPFSISEQEERRKREQRGLLIRFGTAAFFSMQLMVFSAALYAGYFEGMGEEFKTLFHLITLGLATPVVFYSGWPFFRASLRGLRQLHFNMDVLVATGSTAAYVYSIYQITQGGEVFFDTAAMIITFILLGRYLETGARGRASEAIGRLMGLSPREARVLGGTEPQSAERSMIPIDDVEVGALVEVLPGEKMPLDGVVRSGRSEADESMLTGESRPVPKEPGSEVYGGTMNLYGAFVFEVTRVGEDTALAAIVRAVEDAQSRRAPVQAVADRVVGWFVPAVIVLALATLGFWLLRGIAPSEAVMNAVSVLVIACPCALGLATPLAILVGTTHGASNGILIKGGDIIEKSKDIGLAVLDKTGTITRGRPVLSAYAGAGVSDDRALALAASLERYSEHSLAKAIVEAARNIELHKAGEFLAEPGRGVRGMIEGSLALVGSAEFLASEGIELDAGGRVQELAGRGEAEGSTVVYLAHEGRLRGVFVIADEVRPEAPEVVAELRKMGLKVAMVTGDNHTTASAVAEKLGIDEVMARKSPVDKADVVRDVQDRGIPVVMVGDGINDAPALVEADVGVAMGRATDAALESAGMVLMREDLGLLPRALRLSRKTFTIIRQNIFWAFFYNSVTIPLAMMGVLHPIVAAIAMAASSLSVVGNSLRARG